MKTGKIAIIKLCAAAILVTGLLTTSSVDAVTWTSNPIYDDDAFWDIGGDSHQTIYYWINGRYGCTRNKDYNPLRWHRPRVDCNLGPDSLGDWQVMGNPETTSSKRCSSGVYRLYAEAFAF